MVSPLILTTGLALTVNMGDTSDVQPVEVCVNWNVVVPAARVVTKPLLLMVATLGFELVQIPPELGDKEELDPIQTAVEPVKLIPGFGLMETGLLGSEEQLEEEMVKVK